MYLDLFNVCHLRGAFVALRELSRLGRLLWKLGFQAPLYMYTETFAIIVVTLRHRQLSELTPPPLPRAELPPFNRSACLSPQFGNRVVT